MESLWSSSLESGMIVNVDSTKGDSDGRVE